MIIAIIVGAISVVGAATALISIISSSDEDKDSKKVLEQKRKLKGNKKKSKGTSKSDRDKAGDVQASPDKVVEDNKPVETSQDLGATGVTPEDNSDKQGALQARYLREGAKPKVHYSKSAKGKVTKPTKKPAVKFYDWSKKEYVSAATTFVQSVQQPSKVVESTSDVVPPKTPKVIIQPSSSEVRKEGDKDRSKYIKSEEPIVQQILTPGISLQLGEEDKILSDPNYDPEVAVVELLRQMSLERLSTAAQSKQKVFDETKEKKHKSDGKLSSVPVAHQEEMLTPDVGLQLSEDEKLSDPNYDPEAAVIELLKQMNVEKLGVAAQGKQEVFDETKEKKHKSDGKLSSVPVAHQEEMLTPDVGLQLSEDEKLSDPNYDPEAAVIELLKQMNVEKLGAAAQGKQEVSNATEKYKYEGYGELSSVRVSSISPAELIACSGKQFNSFISSTCIRLLQKRYSKDNERFKMCLRKFRNMQFIYCCGMLQQLFYVQDNRLYVTDNTEVLLRNLQNPNLCVLVLKLCFALYCTIPLDRQGFCNTVIYNTRIYDKHLLDMLLVKVYEGVQHEGFKFRPIRQILYYQYLNKLSFSNVVLHDGNFFHSMYGLLCELSYLRVNNILQSHDILDFAIVGCAIMCGSMYDNYGFLINNEVSIDEGHDIMSLVEHMGSTGHQRGAFGQMCYDLLYQMRHMYNAGNNQLTKLHNMLFPGVLIEQCSPGFCERAEEHIAGDTMSFNLIITDIASRICRMMDRYHLGPFEYEVSSYARLYDDIVRGLDKGAGNQR